MNASGPTTDAEHVPFWVERWGVGVLAIGLISLHPGGWIELLTRSTYLLALTATVVLAAKLPRRRLEEPFGVAPVGPPDDTFTLAS
jgi:hypothetical protein